MIHTSPLFRPLCIACNVALQARGKNASGTNKYCCPLCGKYQTHKPKKAGRPPRTWVLSSIWFEHWIMDNMTVSCIVTQLGMPRKVVQRELHRYLQEKPEDLTASLTMYMRIFPSIHRDILIDGTVIDGNCCCVVRPTSDPLILSHAFAKKEHQWVVKSVVIPLIVNVWEFRGIVSDGGRAIAGVVHKYFPGKPHQHCMVHQQRNITACLGKYPKTELHASLKIISLLAWDVHRREDLIVWKEFLVEWITLHREELQETFFDRTGKKRFVYQKARTALQRMQYLYQFCFVFLNFINMPRDTNHMEGGILSPLKRKIRVHSGLTFETQQQFVHHYITMHNKRILQKLNCYIPPTQQP